MLDESSLQFSRRVVADLDRADLYKISQASWNPENLSSKHRADSARSGLAPEMDRLASDRQRSVHDVLFAPVPAANRRRTDHAEYAKAHPDPIAEPSSVAETVTP